MSLHLCFCYYEVTVRSLGGETVGHPDSTRTMAARTSVKVSGWIEA
jgi:hypothetical protein